MESTRQHRGAQSKRVATLGKGNHGSLPPSKPPTSAAIMLRRSSNSPQKRDASAILRYPTVQNTRAGSCNSPNKFPNNSLSKEDKMHPLASAFNTTTQTYRSAIYEHAVQRLDESLSHFLIKLHGSNGATVSFPVHASKPPDPIQIGNLADKINRSAEKFLRRVGSYNVLMGHSEDHIEKTLDEGLTEFAARHRARFQELHALEEKWETVVGEIWRVSAGCLGQGTMLNLLMQPSLPTLPTYDEPDILLADESEPKPARKKVKFHGLESESHPELPKFISTKSVYTELVRPTQVSKGTAAKLESKIDALGTQQIKEFVSIEKESRHSWAKKLRGVLHLLQDE